MAEWELNTPVAFLIYKRPEKTKRVFDVIRQVKPPTLLIVADGPQVSRPGEREKCAAARAVIEQVDWCCEVIKNFSDGNMGCRQRVSSGLSWVFSIAEEAIIIEDDCLPHPTFFRFCEELLERYRYDDRVMMISGHNRSGEWKSDIQSYHFSNYGNIWGWSSWRRAWKYFDVDMELWSKADIRNKIKDVICDEERYKKERENFDRTYLGEIDTWDIQWIFARLLQSGLSIVPSLNLVSNIGLDDEATHTTIPIDDISRLPVYAVSFPLLETSSVTADREFDRRHVSMLKMLGDTLHNERRAR